MDVIKTILRKITVYTIVLTFWALLMLVTPWILLLDCIEQRENLYKNTKEILKKAYHNSIHLIQNPIIIEND